MDKKNLEELGLSEREAKVYLALLQLGSGSVAEIAAKAKINRTTTYDVLEYLTRYSIASHVGDKKKKHYVAENPENLAKYLDKKSEEFKAKSLQVKSLMPELKGIFNLAPQKPKVRFYEGDDGIIAMYEDSLTSKTEILSWLDIRVTHDFSFEYFDNYYKRRTEKGIHIKAIVNDDPIADQFSKNPEDFLRELRIVPREMMEGTPECYIYDNKVSFMSVKERFGVMIESKDIADAQRKLYELAWDKATQIDKHSKGLVQSYKDTTTRKR